MSSSQATYDPRDHVFPGTLVWGCVLEILKKEDRFMIKLTQLAQVNSP